MFALGHPELNPAASLFLLGGLGFWVFCNRRKNMWLLIGITALVARFWTYHGWYDDLKEVYKEPELIPWLFSHKRKK